jgi:hypothetical protein
MILATVIALTCAVTEPNGIHAGNEPTTTASYGTRRLSTMLWTEGTIVFTPGGSGFRTPDGALGMKFPWWRGEGVRGQLRIEGRRLDGDAPALRSEFTDYGDRGFQASYLIFPTPGCWEVTGRAGDASITFITSVVKVGTGPTWLREPVYRRGRW